MNHQKKQGFLALPIVENLINWQWIDTLFHWLLKSGGTLAGIVFLSSGIWLSISNSVPGLIALIMPVPFSTLLTYLSKTSFTALPEIILFLSALNTLDQIKAIRACRTGTLARHMAWTWAVLFGLPTVAFITYALINIARSLLSKEYSMPDTVIVLRGLTCFIYALLVFIYNERGRDCFANELTKRDTDLAIKSAEWVTEKSRLDDEIDRLNTEIEQANTSYSVQIESMSRDHADILIAQEQTVNRLAEKASSLASRGLENYPIGLIEWVNGPNRTCTLEELIARTGHSKRKIQSANVQMDSRNKSRYRMSSVADWLRRTPPPITEANIIDFEAYREEPTDLFGGL